MKQVCVALALACSMSSRSSAAFDLPTSACIVRGNATGGWGRNAHRSTEEDDRPPGVSESKKAPLIWPACSRTSGCRRAQCSSFLTCAPTTSQLSQSGVSSSSAFVGSASAHWNSQPPLARIATPPCPAGCPKRGIRYISGSKGRRIASSSSHSSPA